MSTQLAKPNDASTELGRSLAKIEQIVDQCSLATIKNQGRFEQAFTMSRGISQLRQMITKEMMTEIMELQGSPLGFRTDKDAGGGGGYGMEVVKDCLIVALLSGVYPVGNEFNIIAGRPYITKEGFTRKLNEFEGLTDLRIDAAVPRMANGGAVVACDASWRLDGKPMSMKAEIPIRVNSGMGVDAILGKADRKMKARIYSRITGSEFTDGDVDDAPARQVSSIVVNSGKTLEKINQQTGEVTSNGAPGTSDDPFTDQSQARGTHPASQPASAPPSPASGHAESSNTIPEDNQLAAPDDGSQQTWPEELPEHAHADQRWIDDAITMLRPANKPVVLARREFHVIHSPQSWTKLSREQRQHLYRQLVDGSFARGSLSM